MTVCSVPDCNRTERARGLCNAHYKRGRRNGTLDKLPLPTLEERFWAKVDKSGECWLWTGSFSSVGYGSIRRDGGLIKAHRLAYELLVGLVPHGMELDHTCHNRACVNPRHLRAVTRKQNLENRSGAQRNSKTGVWGVSWDAESKKWRAQIKHDGTVYNLGRYATVEEADTVARAARLRMFTHNDADRILA